MATNVTTINTAGEAGEGNIRLEPVGRIPVSLQKLIVKRAASFLFGNDVLISAEAKAEKEKQVLEAVKKILTANKSNTLNKKMARTVFSCTEAAELWFPVPVEKTMTGTSIVSKVKDALNNAIGNKYHEAYGFKSKFRLRCALLSPLNDDELFPFFDETGDMVAFSREYTIAGEEGKNIKYFETYTADKHLRWKQDDSGWTMDEGYPKTNIIGKIPIIYARQDDVEWADVQALIDRLEKLLSNFADTNDYHASPKIFVKGQLVGFAKKGETGAIIQGEDNSEAKYLSWEHAPESVKLEKETLLNLIYTLTQTPDISFESVKGLDNISGIALKLMFLDAHLKVADKQEIFDEFLQRRCNVIKAFISKFNTSLAAECESLEITPEIKPYMIDDIQSLVEMLTTANGQKPLVSRKLAASLSGLADDTEADFQQMELEKKEDSFVDVTELTM
jgi:SPP1 family phage portal protein